MPVSINLMPPDSPKPSLVSDGFSDDFGELAPHVRRELPSRSAGALRRRERAMAMCLAAVRARARMFVQAAELCRAQRPGAALLWCRNSSSPSPPNPHCGGLRAPACGARSAPGRVAQRARSAPA
jgi:hypothetical protein